MKKIGSLFAFFLLLFSQGFSSGVNEEEGPAKYVDYYWSGNEEDLYLNLELIDGFEFGSTYHTRKNAQGEFCEVICQPVEGYDVFSAEGNKLQSISVAIELKNDKDPSKVSFVLTMKALYENEKDLEGGQTITKERTLSGFLKNPSISLQEMPKFFPLEEVANKGVVSFKNSFPYSEISK